MRSKNLIVHAKHRLPIYGYQIHLYVSHDAVKTFNRVCHLWDCEPETGKGAGFRAMCINDGEGCFAIFFNKGDVIESSISHEVKHCTDDIMDYIGAGHCKKCSQEPQAYLTGYLSCWVRRVLKRKGIRSKLN